jgi:protein gp37
MAETSRIDWTDATVNFWWGCRKVGPGCDHCYAETWAKRFGIPDYVDSGVRLKIKGAIKLIRRLQRTADKFEAKHGRRRRVFIQSMSDFFDNEVDPAWRAEAWAEIVKADRLDIQLVTKRVSNVAKMIGGFWPAHVGLMATVVNQDEANRDVPRLLRLKTGLKISWVGLSIEPIQGGIDLISWMGDHAPYTGGLDWVIVGGESGSEARPAHPDWFRALRDECAAAGVPFFFKQWGEWVPCAANDGHWPVDTPRHIRLEPTGARSLQGWPMHKVGKAHDPKALDGVVHHEFPRLAA